MSLVKHPRFTASILATVALLLAGCGLENEPVPQQEQTPLEQQEQTLASDGTEVMCNFSSYNRQLYCDGMYRGGTPPASHWNYQVPGGWMGGWNPSGSRVNWYNCCQPRPGYGSAAMAVWFSIYRDGLRDGVPMYDAKTVYCETDPYGQRTTCL